MVNPLHAFLGDALFRAVNPDLSSDSESLRAALDDPENWKIGEMPLTPGMLGPNFQVLLTALSKGKGVGKPAAKLLNKAWAAEAKGASESFWKNLLKQDGGKPIYGALRDAKGAKFMGKMRKSALADLPAKERYARQVKIAQRELAETPLETFVKNLETIAGQVTGTGRKTLMPNQEAMTVFFHRLAQIVNAADEP